MANVKCFPRALALFFPHIPYFLFSAPLSHHLQAHAGKEREQQQKKQRHCYWQHWRSSFPGHLTGVISNCGNKKPEAERSAVSTPPFPRWYPTLRWAAPQAVNPQLQFSTQIWTVATALRPTTPLHWTLKARTRVWTEKQEMLWGTRPSIQNPSQPWRD